MARVTPVEGWRAPLLLHVLNLASRRLLGQEATPFTIVAHNPGFLRPFLGMSRFSQGKTQLAPEIRSLAVSLVAQLNMCAWCIDYARAQGAKDRALAEKLAAVHAYRTSPLFTPAERAALAYAEAMTQVGARVADETFAELRRHFSEREIVELTVAIAAENFYNRINAALEVEAQGFCAVPGTRATSQRVAA